MDKNINEVRLPIEDYELVIRPTDNGYTISVADEYAEVPALHITKNVRRIKGELLGGGKDVKIVSLNAGIVVRPEHPDFCVQHALLTPEETSRVTMLSDGTLWCPKCRCTIPNTANHEMRKEGAFAHSHICGIKGEGEKYELNFADVVERLDDAKTLYYKLRFADDHPSVVGFEIRDYAMYMRDALETSFAHMMDKKGVHWCEQLNGIKDSVFGVIPEAKRDIVAKALDDIASCSETPFYDRGGYGKFWDEVPLPSCIENFFEEYIECIVKPQYSGLLGVDWYATEGMCGISYYDLSNILLCFESLEAAEKFERDNAVEPSTKLVFHNGAWRG